MRTRIISALFATCGLLAGCFEAVSIDTTDRFNCSSNEHCGADHWCGEMEESTLGCVDDGWWEVDDVGHLWSTDDGCDGWCVWGFCAGPSAPNLDRVLWLSSCVGYDVTTQVCGNRDCPAPTENEAHVCHFDDAKLELMCTLVQKADLAGRLVGESQDCPTDQVLVAGRLVDFRFMEDYRDEQYFCY